MSRENNPENSNPSRSMKNGGSAPIPPMRLSAVSRKPPIKAPIKVRMVVSEQPTLTQPAPPPTHPVQMLVSESAPIPIRPKPARRRKVKVLISPHKSLWHRTDRPRMTEARPKTPGSWKVKLLITSLILGSIAVVGGGGVIAALFIFNPAAVNWLPGNKAGSGHIAQTLKEIKAEAHKAGVFAGEPLYVSSYPGFAKGALGQDDFLLPIYASSMTDKLTELRAYRQTKVGEKTAFELKDRIAIEGPSEADAIAPLTASSELIQGSDRLLTLKEIEFVEGKAPASGIWLQLSGDWERSGSQVVYGRMLHYDPLRASFHTLLTWTSPASEIPRWQQITGDQQLELLVNQTVGLEPHFQVYRLKARQSQSDPLQLEPIAFTQPALKGRTYEDAMLLAQNGLWAAAKELLEAIKQNSDWSANAQSQLDVVKLHAQATKAQADRSWASPTQQILALLVDGRWSKALSQLRTAHKNGYDINNFLNSNVGHLMPKVEASLMVYPGEGDVLRWGTLLKAIVTNNREAVIWLQQHQAPAGIQEILALLNIPLDNISITNPEEPLSSTVKVKGDAPPEPNPEPIDSAPSLDSPVEPPIGLPEAEIQPPDPESSEALPGSAEPEPTAAPPESQPEAPQEATPPIVPKESGF
jgi:hypothetical protein